MLKHAGKDAAGMHCLGVREPSMILVDSYICCLQEFRVNIWDASGDLKFIDVRNEFYKETQGVILDLRMQWGSVSN